MRVHLCLAYCELTDDRARERGGNSASRAYICAWVTISYDDRAGGCGSSA